MVSVALARLGASADVIEQQARYAMEKNARYGLLELVEGEGAP